MKTIISQVCAHYGLLTVFTPVKSMFLLNHLINVDEIIIKINNYTTNLWIRFFGKLCGVNMVEAPLPG